MKKNIYSNKEFYRLFASITEIQKPLQKYLLILFFTLTSAVVFGQATLPVTRTSWGATPFGWTDAGVKRTTTFACSGSDGGSFQAIGQFHKVYFDSSRDKLNYSLKDKKPTNLNDSGNQKSQDVIDVELDDVPIKKVISINSNGTGGGDWSAGSTWVGGSVPSAVDNVTILAGDLVYTSSTLTRSAATTVDGSFQLNSGGYASGTAFKYGSSGTLIFNKSGAAYDVNSGDVFWPSANGPFNVNILQGGLTLNSGANKTVGGIFQTASAISLSSASLTLNGTAQINMGGYFNNPPTYGMSSTLVYNTSFSTGNEWTGNGTAGVGIPANILVKNGTLSLPNSNRGIPGNITLNSGTSLDLNNTFGDFYLGGNWDNAGLFNPNGRAVNFNGNLTQTIKNNSGETFNYLVHNGAGLLKFVNNVTINASSGDVLQLLNGTLDLNGKTLDLTGTGGNVKLSGAQVLNSTSAGAIFNISGGLGSVKYIYGGTLSIPANVTTVLQSGLDFGSSVTTILGKHKIQTNGFVPTNAPIYGNTSTLEYNGISSYDVGNEWNGNSSTAGNGVPQNVSLISSTLNFPNFNHGLAGNLNIDSNSTLNLNATSGDLYIAGNWIKAGTFNPSNRAVFFNGSANQTITGATTFDYLTINNSAGVTLANSVLSNKTLDFTNGKMTLDANDLTIGGSGSITNYNASKYVVTNGVGRLTKNSLGASTFTFPIGLNATNFTPVAIKNTSGTSDLAVNVVSPITSAVTDNTKVVQLQWNIQSSTNTTATISPVWVTGYQGSSFVNTGPGELANYITPNYTIYPVTLNTNTTSATNVALQAGANSIVVGNTGAIYTSNVAYFRSNVVSGLWSTPSSWQYSTDNMTWVTSIVAPTSSASGIIIRNGNQITIANSGVSLTKTTVQNGGVLEITTSSSFAVSGVANGIELMVENGGTFLVNSVDISNPTGNAFGLIKTGGKLTAGSNFTNGTDFGTAYLDSTTGLFYFGDAAVCNWVNTKTILKSSGSASYFKIYQAGNIPIFRLSASPNGSFGSTTNNVFNALLEANANFSLSNSGSKTFTGGILGTATVSQNSGSGYLILGNGTNIPTIGGSVTLNVLSAGLQLPNGANVPLNASPTIASTVENYSFNRQGGNLTVDGTLDITNMRITNTATGGVVVNGTLRTSNTGGLYGGGSAILNPSNLTLNAGSTIEYYATADQQISSAPDYYNITFSGSGTKTTQGAISVNTNGIVKITGTTTVDAKSNLASTISNNTAFNMDGGRLIISTGGTQPNMGGIYILTGGVVEFAGNSITNIRAASPRYYNIEVSGTNIFAGTSTNAGVTIKPGGSFTVKNSGILKVTNAEGFSGGSSTAIKSTNSPIINLEPNSIIDYSGTDQNISNAILTFPTDANYQNLRISGTRTKTATGLTKVKSLTYVDASELFIANTLDTGSPNIFWATKGIKVTSPAVFHLGNNANLIQDISASNTGNILVDRIAKLPANGYNYWSSPVSGQPILGDTFSPGTPDNRIFAYRESNDRFYQTGDASFQTGKGYAILGTGATVAGKTFNFTGIPNNGNLSTPSLNWTDANHGYNLIGNPYPSNLDFNLFWTANSGIMYSSAYFWTNNTYTPNQQGSNYSGSNYAIYNGTGGNPAAYQGASAGPTPTASIKPGQGFIIQMRNTGSLNFTNSMRDPAISVFFNNKQTSEKDRYHLTLTTPTDVNNVILIGYVNGATDDYEKDFDADLLVQGSDSFYSKLGTSKLAIQGRSFPLVDSDVVPLGAVYYQTGLHKISLSDKEGVFKSVQDVYLKDNLLNKVTDLSERDYTFTANKGTDDSRFKIVYKPQTILANSEIKKSNLNVYRDSDSFVIRDNTEKITKVELFDSSGKVVMVKNANSLEVHIDAVSLPSGVYILKIHQNEKVILKKVQN